MKVRKSYFLYTFLWRIYYFIFSINNALWLKGVIVIDKKYIPLWEKANLTLEEASVYFGIGQNKLRELTNSDSCPYVIWCGNKRLIKRKLFLEYLEKMYSI